MLVLVVGALVGGAECGDASGSASEVRMAGGGGAAKVRVVGVD